MPDPELARLIALVVFVGAYAGLGIGRLPPFRVDRTGVAIIGAAVMVVSGVSPWDRAVAAVDAHTLVLLFGMMIVAAYLRLSGFFSLVTSLAGVPGRATGGPVSAGRAYLVGERGPELFVPPGEGRIVSGGGARDVKVAIAIQSPSPSDPQLLQKSSRQIARAVRSALRDSQ